MQKKHGLLIAGSVTLCLMFPSAGFSMDTEYLDAVKKDYAEFSSGSFEALPDSSWMPSATTFSADGTASLESFNDFLLKRFPGTYILYAKLPEAQQTEVWQDYVNTGNLGAIRSNIFSLRRSTRFSSRRQAITNLPD